MKIEDTFSKLNAIGKDLLLQIGVPESWAHIINILTLSLLVTIISVGANYLAKQFIIQFIKRLVERSTNKYDDIFYEKGVFNKLSHLAPAIIIANLAPIPLHDFNNLISIIITGTNLYILTIIIFVILSAIDALNEIYEQTPIGKQRSIKGYLQAVKLIIYFIGALMFISIIFKKDLTSLFTGLTAFAAVLMFVFKDAILGMIAGIQISSNDILKIGDYIEIPSKNIEGNVIDIKLSTVKILNNNRTISILPVYYFVSDAFFNWRGLEQSEGRRLKRFVYIDIHSIKFCNNELIKKLANKWLVEENYILQPNDTNLKLFRTHLEHYLQNSGYFNLNATFMVRYLQPTENGIPLEIYAYTYEKSFVNFEKIQSEIFEYLIAIIPEFELRIYQKISNWPTHNLSN